MTINQFIAILKARWTLILALIAVTVGSTIGISLILPSKYVGKATVVVDVKSPDPIAGVVLQGVMLPSYMATQVNVIQSERVARKVIQNLRLDADQGMRQQWQEDSNGVGDMASWLAKRLLKNLEVKPDRESNAIDISYVGLDPNFAAAMANAFVRAYIDTTIELRVEPARQYNAMFVEQAKVLREQLEAAQTKLSTFQRERGLLTTPTDSRLDIESARLSELSSQLVGLQALSADSSSRKEQSTANSTEVLNNAVVSSLKADLSRQEARFKELSATFGPEHPQLRQLEANIAELKVRIDAEISRVNSSLGVNNNINSARVAAVRAALEAQREKVLALKEEREQSAVLFRDVDNAQRAYDAIQARYYQTSMESQSNAGNVSILQNATPDPDAASPKLVLNTALALVLGSLLACGVAMAVELGDRKLRDRQDFAQVLNVPLLGSMPKIKKTRPVVANVARPLALRKDSPARLPAPQRK
jgi:polysaccharide biosynthesis transport protein